MCRARKPLAVAALIALAACKGRDERAPAAAASATPRPTASAIPSAAPSSTASAVATVDAAPEPERGCGDHQPSRSGGGDDTMIAMDAGCIDRREVTTAEYVACAESSACPKPSSEGAELSMMCNADAASDRGEHPMNCVSFAMAEAYCKHAGKRLPTGDEWMRAARGQGGGRYPWGASSPVSILLNACGSECVGWKREHAPDLAKSRVRLTAEMFPGDDGFAGTAPVGTFSAGASAVGALDMAGNVEEWTADGEVRGGSWLSTRDAEVRADAHRKLDPEARAATVGFRCAR